MPSPRRRPYSIAYARRRLAAIDSQLAALRAKDCTGDWRAACDKRRALNSLEAQQAIWQARLVPRKVEFYALPF